MPIAAVVVTLDPRTELREHALERLAGDARVELGERQSTIVPAVLDTATAEEGEALFQSLLVTPGVLQVDIVSVDFTCDEAP